MSSTSVLTPREDGYVRKRWSVQECRVLQESGLLTSGKYELIEGEILFKMGQGRLHIYVVTRLLAVLSAIFGMDAVQSQAPIGIGERDAYNDPEPDVAVLRGTVHDYLERSPDPANEVLLVVEAADTTLPGDTSTKAHLYARHGVPEYWVIAILRRELMVYREPTMVGYTSVQSYGDSETVTPLYAPGRPVRVADLLPS